MLVTSNENVRLLLTNNLRSCMLVFYRADYKKFSPTQMDALFPSVSKSLRVVERIKEAVASERLARHGVDVTVV